MAGAAGAARRQDTFVPPASHIIVVIMENHSYDQVRTAPYTASLIASGSSFSSSYGITHPSQPNYLAIWSGSTQGVLGNTCPAPGSPFSADNLGHACEAAGISWRSYAEDLPSPGWSGCSANGGLYHRRHCPWTNFGNLDHLNERPYEDLAADIAAGTLPDLAFVIPNNCHNSHDCTVAEGDAWLAANVPAMLQGVGPSGLVILTWDEDDSSAGNHILTVFVGGVVRSDYVSGQTITHYTVLRTLSESLGITPFGAAVNETPIGDVWLDPASGVDVIAPGSSWLGTVRPNPSTGGIEARLSLPNDLPVEAAIYDAAGRRIAFLPHPSALPDGKLRWNGRADNGGRARSGLYFLQVRAGTLRQEQKVILLP
jgi:acid phosphatase